jgi:hypothetical protein
VKRVPEGSGRAPVASGTEVEAPAAAGCIGAAPVLLERRWSYRATGAEARARAGRRGGARGRRELLGWRWSYRATAAAPMLLGQRWSYQATGAEVRARAGRRGGARGHRELLGRWWGYRATAAAFPRRRRQLGICERERKQRMNRRGHGTVG